MATLPKVVTYEEWLQMPIVQDAREEVVNGEIRLVPPNKMPHPRVVARLTRHFDRLDPDQVEVFGSTFGLVIRREPLTCRVPDLALFLKETIVEEDGYIHSAPQLAIEVLSPTEGPKEKREKLRDYESIGVPEVWLVSPESQTVQVFGLHEGKLARESILAEGELRPKHFPEAIIDITTIWPD
jgi:Uma2 family endonuclease